MAGLSKVEIIGDGNCFFYAIFESARLQNLAVHLQALGFTTTHPITTELLDPQRYEQQQQFAEFMRRRVSTSPILLHAFDTWIEFARETIETRQELITRINTDLGLKLNNSMTDASLTSILREYKANLPQSVANNSDDRPYVTPVEYTCVSRMLNEVGISLTVSTKELTQNSIYVVKNIKYDHYEAYAPRLNQGDLQTANRETQIVAQAVSSAKDARSAGVRANVTLAAQMQADDLRAEQDRIANQLASEADSLQLIQRIHAQEAAERAKQLAAEDVASQQMIARMMRGDLGGTRRFGRKTRGKKRNRRTKRRRPKSRRVERV